VETIVAQLAVLAVLQAQTITRAALSVIQVVVAVVVQSVVQQEQMQVQVRQPQTVTMQPLIEVAAVVETLAV
jgi:hypothetical protein